MDFVNLVEFDPTSEALIFKTKNDDINSLILFEDKEIEFLKIKKSAIAFFIISENFKNPIAPEITIKIYTLNNKIIQAEFTGSDAKLLNELKEYVSSIII
jgi:hypothetical protein